jgi:ABC-type polysaccharide/polyol phosphate transport system ATPase subunit
MLLREAVFFLASRDKRSEDFWALHDVSFEIGDGETMGVLGRNGSGKSTLLQVVAGAAFPSEGTISTRGRVATLLALGAGLHGDMTGEENIIVNAGFLGLSPEEIRDRMPHIVEFSELAQVIDTPVRFYSSGMKARLGFSIAINVSPDILVIDEVLAVGDMTFQGKSLEKILQMKESGTTILYASQSPNQVAEFCSRAIWLEQGKVQASGAARDVAGEYARAMEARMR